MSKRIPTANEMYFGELPLEPAHVEALETLFFRTVFLPDGTRKTTSYRRLDDLNALVAQHLPPQRPLAVMDVACSSAVGTIEWLEALSRSGVECHMTAGDASLNAFVLSIGRNLHALVDRRGRVMQYEVGGVGLEVPLRKRRIPRYGLSALLIKCLAAALGATLSDARLASRGGRWGMRMARRSAREPFDPRPQRYRCRRGRHRGEQKLFALLRCGASRQHPEPGLLRQADTRGDGSQSARAHSRQRAARRVSHRSRQRESWNGGSGSMRSAAFRCSPASTAAPRSSPSRCRWRPRAERSGHGNEIFVAGRLGNFRRY